MVGVTVGALVGASVVGARVGARLVGCSVVGASVGATVGAKVVGAAVVGATVVGAAVVGDCVGTRVSPYPVGDRVTGARVGEEVACAVVLAVGRGVVVAAVVVVAGAGANVGAADGGGVVGMRVKNSPGCSLLLLSMMLRLCCANKADTTMVVTASTRIVKSNSANLPWYVRTSKKALHCLAHPPAVLLSLVPSSPL